MAAPTAFDTALELLAERFTNEPTKRKGGYLTAYAAVKLAYGVERDDHAIAYNGSNWSELAATLADTFDALDGITAESSERPVPFIVWSSRPERTYEEVEAVLREAARRHPDMTAEELALLRPAPTGLLGVRKMRWIVCSQLALIAAGRATSLGAVIESLLPFDETTDIDLIARLDLIIDDEAIPWEKPNAIKASVPLSRAWGVKTKSDASYSFAQFLNDFGAEAELIPQDDAALEEALELFYEAHKKDERPDQAAPMVK